MRTPLAPIGWPNDLRPPLGLIGMSPSSAVRPSSTSLPPSPFLQKPRSSVFEISVHVKQSCTSAKSMSLRPRCPPSCTPALRRLHRRRGSPGSRRSGRSTGRPVSTASAAPFTQIGGFLNFARQVGAADDRRGGAVGRRAAVEEAERRRDDRRLQHLLDGDLRAQVRLLVLARRCWWFFTATLASVSRPTPNVCM